ncbi:MAG: class I SAM-dependent methyltransferase, partial [Dehalococcoidia bacterium]|nr:class I SAM-dependent methyltransferase [Dehalococcoidia bacterium]
MRYVRRVPGLRGLRSRLRARWDQMRPIPLPRYSEGTPEAVGTGILEPLFPPNAETLGAAALSSEAATFVSAVLAKLTPTQDIVRQQFFYEVGQGKFGPYWRYADILTALRAASTMIRPNSYLEIGVRRGRSAAVVAASCPQCAIYGFDLWIPGYHNEPNPGPDFVRSELRAVGHEGPVELVAGDSRETVPAFLQQQPDLYFDVITVDGDHSV